MSQLEGGRRGGLCSWVKDKILHVIKMEGLPPNKKMFV
jgi:hypothetical protein